MAQSRLSSKTSEHYDDAIRFVNWMADEFQWEDLSEDVVMDIGCGVELICCLVILLLFPNVRGLIAVDKESTVFQTAEFRDRIEFCVGDIQKRDSLESYEGKMDKIISTNAFEQIIDKEIGFRNVYRLLKPGGEAGFLFCVNSCMHKFLTVLSEMPKYGAILQDLFAPNLYQPEHGEEYYKELLEKIGFKHVRAFEEGTRFLFDTEKDFQEYFFEGIKGSLEISPEDAEAFKAEVLELYEKIFDRSEGKLCCVYVYLNLLGVKPMESSDSESKDTTVV